MARLYAFILRKSAQLFDFVLITPQLYVSTICSALLAKCGPQTPEYSAYLISRPRNPESEMQTQNYAHRHRRQRNGSHTWLEKDKENFDLTRRVACQNLVLLGQHRKWADLSWKILPKMQKALRRGKKLHTQWDDPI